MACYRLTYKNTRSFEIDIDNTPIEGETWQVATAVIFRVSGEAREARPMLTENGEPLKIHAVTERAALAIANSVIAEVTGSRLVAISTCADTFEIPLPTLA